MRRLQFIQGVVGVTFLCFTLRFFLYWTIVPEPMSLYYSEDLLRRGGQDPYTGKVLNALEKNVTSFNLEGRIFSGRMTDLVGGASSAILHSFSPAIERAVAQMFPYKHAKYREINAISPAITWYKGNIVVVIRVWLNYERVFRNKLKENNTFQDNFLYTQMFNRYMQPIDTGRLLGIPVPKQYTVYTGPYDPRILATSNQQLLVTFPMPMNIDGTDTLAPYIWDFDRNKVMKPSIQGQRLARLDTNWVPLYLNGKLHYVYSFNPLRVLECDTEAICHYVHNEKPISEFPFIDTLDALRGGTPFEPYKGPYYLSVAHSSVRTKGGGILYGAHLVLLRTDKWRIVYVSDVLHIEKSILEKINIVRNFAIKRPFFYPVGIIIESDDSIAIGFHINDRQSYVARIRGIGKIIQKAIEVDLHSDKEGPREVRTIQTYVKELMLRQY